MSPMSRSDARKRAAGIHKPRTKEGYPIDWFVLDESQTFTREHLTEWQQIVHDRVVTDPRNALKERHPMTSPTQRRHDELRDLLTEIRDRLPEPVRPPDVEWDCAACGEPEPTWQHECPDVTEEPPGLTALLRRALGDDTVNATVTDAPVDTAPDVDPDEALWTNDAQVDDDPDLESIVRAQLDGHGVECHGAVRITSARIARAAREHIDRNSPPDVTPLLERECEQQRVRAEKAEAELASQVRAASIDARKAAKLEADVLRLTRERGDLRGRIDELIRERGQAIERYKALRADVERHSKAADKWCKLYADGTEKAERLTRERDEAVLWWGRLQEAVGTFPDPRKDYDPLVPHQCGWRLAVGNVRDLIDNRGRDE